MNIARKFKLEIIIFIFFLFIFSFSSSLQAVGVRPLVVNMDMERGQTQEFELELTPENKQEIVALNLYYPRQQVTGSLTYEEGNLEEHPVLNWLSYPEEITVPAGEKETVKVEVNVPYNVKGTHTAVIMVEPIVKEAETGITFKVRYAVRVNINVDAPGLRKEADVKSIKLVANEKGQPLIKTYIKNPSLLSYNAAGEVTIRNENRQLLERVQIKSKHAEQVGRKKTTIYPGSEVIFNGEVKEPLSAGKYELQLFLYYADGRQVIKRKQIEIGNEYIDPENLDYIEVKPALISQKLMRGGAHTEALNIRNRMGDSIQVQLGTEKIKSKYEHSLLDKFQIQLRGNQKFKLEGRHYERPVLIVRAPRENIEDGGYYDRLKIKVSDPDSGEVMQTETLNMEMVIGDKLEYSGDIQDITTQTIEDEVLFSATVLNKGNVHFKPRARIYLLQDEEIKYTLFLETAEKDSKILPEMTGLLTEYVKDIEPGEYTARVTLQYQGENIGENEFELKIKPHNKENSAGEKGTNNSKDNGEKNEKPEDKEEA